MLQDDAFEKFREQKMVEKLEKKVKSSAAVRCPDDGGTSGGPEKVQKVPFYDPKRSWIY